VRHKDFSALPPAKLRFIEPMYARLVNELPERKDWLHEVKFDGYRCLAARDSTGVTIWSRRGNLFTNQFPHITITRASERLPSGILVDGEIVALDESGRVSFNLLHITVRRPKRCASTCSTCSPFVAGPIERTAGTQAAGA
jgi:ATP-dependent DNA ligase